ncbi:uncharacterized protein LOC126252309 [Schistocerca nitens]|uniref:uncharacterized protein LOC126252309 n=1 Tax=Schistocerca nitens TaxID=7011 RepID=UPI002118137B|nr:uncharacterized protein LOC126252309 [Schistocerca nitens]
MNDIVSKLKKALYGLKDSAKNRDVKLHTVITRLGFVTNDFLVLRIAPTSQSQIDNLKLLLSDNFKMKVLGLIRNYVGMNIVQSVRERIIIICQILVSTPMEENFDQSVLKREKSENEDNEKDMENEQGLYVLGCRVSWGPKKQPTVPLSSTESEFVP